MPPIPAGVGTEYLHIVHQVDQQVEILSDLYLLEPWQVRAAVRFLHRTTPLYLSDIIADGGHHALHKLLWQVREGEISVTGLDDRS